jgi:CRISPR system Cascade subunit CasE
VSTGHRLIWSLFAGDGSLTSRDFLWRQDDNGVFYTLSKRPPPENHALLEVDPPKPFAPMLAAGDRLRFSLRANPTVSRPLDDFRSAIRDPLSKRSRKTAHDDIVMRALHTIPSGMRAKARGEVIESAGRTWLERQGRNSGFALPLSAGSNDLEAGFPILRIDGYQVLRPPRSKSGNQMRIGVLEFTGILTVTDPELFLRAVIRGFGRAKAYGCGLLLIARV